MRRKEIEKGKIQSEREREREKEKEREREGERWGKQICLTLDTFCGTASRLIKIVTVKQVKIFLVLFLFLVLVFKRINIIITHAD